jgi:hypothetical protein
MNRRFIQLALVGALLLVGSAQARASIRYIGGRIMPSVRIVPIYFGSSWSFSDISNTQTYINELRDYINGSKNPSGKQTVYAQYGVTAAQANGINWVMTDTNPREIQLPVDPEIHNIITAFQAQTGHTWGPDKLFLLLPGPGYSLPLIDPCGFADREGDGKYYAVLPRDCPTFKHKISFHVLATATAPNFDGWELPLNTCFGHSVNFGNGDIALPWDNHLGGCFDTGFDDKMTEVLQVVVTNGDGHLFHTLRHPTSWTPFGDVKAAIGSNPGFFTDVDTQATLGVFNHVVGVTTAGKLFHTIRHETGWRPFADVNAATGAGATSFLRVGLANVNGDLHVCAATSAGGLQHAIRFQNGTWTGFGNVLGQTGSPPSGTVVDVDCTGKGPDMHIAIATSTGGLFHAIRNGAAGNWTGWTNVETAAGDVGALRRVSVANVFDLVNLTAMNTTSDQRVSIRNNSTGAWGAFTTPPNNIQAHDASNAGVLSALHLVSLQNGAVRHRIRDIFGWSAVGDVNAATGHTLPGNAVAVGNTGSLGY